MPSRSRPPQVSGPPDSLQYSHAYTNRSCVRSQVRGEYLVPMRLQSAAVDLRKRCFSGHERFHRDNEGAALRKCPPLHVFLGWHDQLSCTHLFVHRNAQLMGFEIFRIGLVSGNQRESGATVRRGFTCRPRALEASE